MTDREALDLYESIRYNLPYARFKEAVDVAFAALVAKPQWIKTAEQMPEEFEPVLVCRRNKYGERVVEAGHYCGDGQWKTIGSLTKSVSDWMPLPRGPKEDA